MFETVIAAYIYACSQLMVAGITAPADSTLIETRKKCIVRVSECSKKKDPKFNSLSYGETVLDCAKEVY